MTENVCGVWGFCILPHWLVYYLSIIKHAHAVKEILQFIDTKSSLMYMFCCQNIFIRNGMK